MTPERWQRVKTLFDEAVSHDPSDRSAFLDSACEDSELKAEVESLLASEDQDATLLERPVGEILGEILPVGPATGRHFGPYRTVREIGRGGMAVVYAAVRDDDQYRKQVAIKLIKRGMDTDAIVARFLKERQILANLEHPNIARMLDGGMSDDGLPYLVMEYVEGVPIDQYCDQQVLSTEERLKLFRGVCDAVHFAHQNLIVHRDLKPSNILVDRTGAPKLLDFGIAKLLAADRTPSTLVTVDGIRPMTPEYASPEQIRSQPITTASDTYALGVLLYLLLTGHRPYRLHRRTPAEIELAVCERDPQKPSTVLERDTTHSDEDESSETPIEMVSRSRGMSPRSLRRKLSGDLDNIVMKALQKAPERRYGSVEQLSEDIRRHLAGMPVIARPDVLAYRASKFVRRHRWGVTAVLLIVLSLVAGIVATAWQARVADSERVTAEEVSNLLVSLFENSGPDRALGETITARELLDQGAQKIRRELSDQPRTRAKLMDSIGLAYLKLGLYPEAEELLEEAFDSRQQTLGDFHPEVATSMNNMGDLRFAQERFIEAQKLYSEALEIRRQRHGGDRELVAESLNNLAIALNKQGLHALAEPLLRQSLELRLEELGSEHTKVAYVLNNLALVLKGDRKYEEAEVRAREALVMNQRLLAEEHPDLAVNLNNLAEILRAQGECDEAIALFERIIDLRIRVLGDRHPSLATTQNNLAGCLTDLGRYDEAEGYLRASLSLRQETLGIDHPAVAASLNNLARIYYLRRQFDQAEDYYRQALQLHREVGGGDDLAVATHMSNLAVLLERRGDASAAEPVIREALAIRRQLLGEQHPDALASQHKLGKILFKLGRLDDAESELRAELVLRHRNLEAGANSNREVGLTLFYLARVLMKAKQPEQAESLFRESLEIWRQWPEKEWVMVHGTESRLGDCLTALGRYQEAEPLLVGSLSAFRARKSSDDPITQRALQRLVELYEAWGQPDSAARYRNLQTQ